MPTVSSMLSMPDARWTIQTTKHFELYFDRDAFTALEQDSIAEAMERHYETVLSKLQEQPNEREIFSHFIVRTPERYALLTRNQNLTSWHHLNFFSTSSVLNSYMVTMANHPNHDEMIKTELAYLLNNKRWWWQRDWDCDDALGVYVNDNWRGYDLHLLAAFFLKNNISFWHNEVFRFGNRNFKTPIQASLLKYGMENNNKEIFNLVCSYQYSPQVRTNNFIYEWEQMLKVRYFSNPALDTISYFKQIR
ncbi:MAG: hypothetical protein MUF71_10485 [Candidatus Kapabacteria bacterium]|nr:hypothetical protein [Candidatus Kapabacteria bacterium]